MQIFCRETQAQLELNPHLKDNKSESTGKLSLSHPKIKSLWARDCICFVQVEV